MPTVTHIIDKNLPVYATGDQTISGIKNFALRPTVNGTDVLLSGDYTNGIEQYLRNDEGRQINKALPVYINTSNGNNVLFKLASNTGDDTSSRTLGLTKQIFETNGFGYVVTEGLLTNVNTSTANDGDPIWLGPTGNLIYGTANKPKAPNHIVFLGVVERAHATQGKIFVKVQNGFEVDELHDVRVTNLQNRDTLIYNSGSGLWLNRQISTGDIVGMSNFDIKPEMAYFAWVPTFDRNLGLATDIFPGFNTQIYNTNTDVFELTNSGSNPPSPIERIAIKQPGYYHLGLQYYGYDLKLNNRVIFKLYYSPIDTGSFSLVKYTSKARFAATDSDGDSFDSWTNLYISPQQTGYYTFAFFSQDLNPYTLIGHWGSFRIPTFSFYLTKERGL